MQVKNDEHNFDWGIIVNFRKKASEKDNSPLIVDVLLNLSKSSTDGTPIPCSEDEDGEIEVVPVLHTLISKISSLRIFYPKDLRPLDHRKSVLRTIEEVKKRFPNGPPLLSPITDMKINEMEFQDIVKKIEIMEKELFAHPMHNVSLS